MIVHQVPKGINSSVIWVYTKPERDKDKDIEFEVSLHWFGLKTPNLPKS